MTVVEQKIRRHFTDEARLAAAAARRRRIDDAAPVGTLEVFVVRNSNTEFGWEIRRFGAVVVAHSTSTYASMVAARLAGEASLRGERGID